MTELRRIVTFSSPAFNTTETRPYFLNPASFGDDVSRHLIEILRTRGVTTDNAPEQEDFGWYFRFTLAAQRYCFVLGYRPGNVSAEGVWIGTVERSAGLLGSLLGGKRSNIGVEATRLINEAVTALPRVTSIAWHRERDFLAGDEGQGARTPDAS